jgi:hypothetical protein
MTLRLDAEVSSEGDDFEVDPVKSTQIKKKTNGGEVDF